MSDLKQFNTTIANVNTQSYLKNVLGEKKDSFVNNITALVANDESLQACVPTTIMFAAMKATSLSLPLDNNLGFAYVLPYKNGRSNTVEAQFQMGYKGIVQLAVRSGQFKRINVSDVREGEIASRDRLTGDIEFSWITDEAERGKAKVIGYVGYFRLSGGYEKTAYWSVEELVEHSKKYSKAVQKGYKSPWSENFDAMAKKTVLKLMLNKGDAPMSVEMQDAFSYDQAVIYDKEGTKAYVDATDSKPAAPAQVEEAEVVEEAKAAKPSF